MMPPRIPPSELERGRKFLAPSGEVRLLGFSPARKGRYLRGFAEVEIVSCGLRIRDVPVFCGRNGAWVLLPSKPQIEDGRVRVGTDGKIAYSPVLQWRDRARADHFSALVVEAVRAAHPDALEAESP